MKFSLKGALILLYFAKDYDLYLERIYNFGFSLNTVVYAVFLF